MCFATRVTVKKGALPKGSREKILELIGVCALASDTVRASGGFFLTAFTFDNKQSRVRKT